MPLLLKIVSSEIISFDNNSRNSFSNDLLLDNNVHLIEGDLTNPDDLKKIPRP